MNNDPFSKTAPKPPARKTLPFLEQERPVERRQRNVAITVEHDEYVARLAKAMKVKPYRIIEKAIDLLRDEVGEP